MITTVNLVNIHHHTYVNFFFLVMRGLKIYSLSNFQIYNIVLLTRVTLLYVTSPGLIYFITGTLYLVTTFIHVAHPQISSASYFVLSASSLCKVSLVPSNVA